MHCEQQNPAVETTSRRSVNRFCSALFICSLIGLVLVRWNQPDLDRPLEYDEWHTVEYYGWAGLSPSGDMKLLRRAADFESLPAPNLRQLGLGLYRAAAVWKEPNNHVLHSCLVNLTSASHRSPRSVRLPAFACGILFSALMFVLIGPVLGWWAAAPLAGIAAYCLPYVEMYGFEARGYTMVLAFQTLFLIFAFLLARRPGSIGLAVGMAAASAGCFANVISLALDWVFAAYLAFSLVPPTADRRTWRRSMGVQGGALAAVFALFVLDRLIAIVLASQKFGVPLSSPRDFADWLIQTGGFLFPSWVWLGVLAGGAAGTVAMGWSKPYRGIAFLTGLVLLVNLVHFALTKRCPYPRVCGYFLPLVVIGAAHLLQRGMLAVRSGWSVPVFGVFAAILIGPGSGTWGSIAPSGSGGTEGEAREGVYGVVADFDYVAMKYLPDRWLTHPDSVAPDDVRLLALVGESDAEPHQTVWRVGSAMTPLTVMTPPGGSAEWKLGHRDATLYPARATGYRPSDALPESGLIVAVWYPDQGRVGLDPGPLMKLFDQYPIAFHRRAVRLQANYDYFVRPGVFEMIAVSGAERAQLQGLLAKGLEQFGGRAIIVAAETGKPSTTTR